MDTGREMTHRYLATLLAASVISFWPTVGSGLESRDIVRLKQAGVTDETVRILIREKSLETGAFKVDDILTLKKAGLSEATLRMLIAEHSFLKDRQPVVYGEQLHAIKFTSVQDVIRLKEAGLSDTVIQAILRVLQEDNSADSQKAWDMLNSMGILIDKRGVR
jgi:hypothetical protein